MFPFAMQARMVEAWFDAAAASFAMASTIGSAAARSADPWLSGGRPSYAFGSWGPALNSAWPWSWLSGFGPQATSSWNQWPFSFYGGDWMRAFTYGLPLGGWPSAQPWTMGFLMPSYSAFLTPFGTQPINVFATPAETAVRFAASYRTATGHATAAMFDALTPRPTGWSDAAWKMTPMSMFAL